MEYDSDDDLLSGPERDLNGFIIPGQYDFGSPGSASAVGFGSPGSASAVGFGSPRSIDICKHGKRTNSCKKCFNDFNAYRMAQGLQPIAWGIFCKHGINKYKMTNKCPDPECNKRRTDAKGIVVGEEPQPTNLQGVIPESARTFEPPVPNSAGLSFSPLEVSQVLPVKKNLFGTKVFDSSSEEEMGGGGRKKYRKSSKKSKRKSSKKSKRKSSRKARRSLKR